MKLKDLATEKFRWVALFFLALGLAIVIIDNTVLNVAVPYILRDLNSSVDAIQWVISGYALIIATLLITVGRLGDMYGRRRIFKIGVTLFAIGSFIASISQNAGMLFFGEAFIEAIGASMMLTSTLALLASEFQGKERAIAFGVWGSVAGASAALGPLLGGYLTTYYSWRWSLRINVIVGAVALLGSVFIQESRSNEKIKLDWAGIFLSGFGLFSLVFGLIEGQRFGWIKPIKDFTLSSWTWPIHNLSIVPVAFVASALALSFFFIIEGRITKKGGCPILKVSLFENRGFNLGLLTLGIVILGQFGTFFVMPIFLQNALGFNAMQTGLVFLSASIFGFVVGPLSGLMASKIGPKWVVSTGMLFLVAGTFFIRESLKLSATIWSLTPAMIVFGIGMSMASAQLTNLVISSVPNEDAGEASAVNATVRQLSTALGIAIIGAVMVGGITTSVTENIRNDPKIPAPVRNVIIQEIPKLNLESGQTGVNVQKTNFQIADAIKSDIDSAFVSGSQKALGYALYFTILGALASLLIPNLRTKGRPPVSQ